MNSSRDFYKNLTPFTDFQKIMDDEVYQDAPEDWLIVLTDVRGSTQAVREGRYREVNTLGASGIAALLNALQGFHLPYVFGGDGATLLVPSSETKRVVEELRAVQALSQSMFGLEIRAGYVPVSTVRKLGSSVRVAKYQLSPNNELAQFRGGGLAKAEALIKTEAPEATLIKPQGQERQPLLNGLSCRWEPFESQRGTMLTMMVVPETSQSGSAELFRSILKKIESILGHELKNANPVSAERLKGKWPPPTLAVEAKVQSSWLTYPLHWFKVLLITGLAYLITKKNLKVGDFDSIRYKAETAVNSDFKKFDDALRMVVDCSLEQAQLIESFLEELAQAGKLHYGLHRSPQAVMTCLVFSPTENRHLHFIDGSHGGYTQAAAMLKAKLKSI